MQWRESLHISVRIGPTNLSLNDEEDTMKLVDNLEIH